MSDKSKPESVKKEDLKIYLKDPDSLKVILNEKPDLRDKKYPSLGQLRPKKNLRSGGRVSLRGGGMCKIAKKGKGRAYGKNS